MARTGKSIRRADLTKKTLVRPVLLGHPGCTVLRAAGIHCVGIDNRPSGCVWGEGVSSTHLLFFVTQGAVCHEQGMPLARAGECLAVPAIVPKRLRTPKSAAEAVFLHLAPESGWRLPTEEATVSSMVAPAQVQAIVEALIAETVRESVAAEAVVRQWSELLLLYLKQQLPARGQPSDWALRERLDAVWKTVRASLGTAWTVTDLAARVHMSEGHFHRRVKQLYGRSPMEVIRRLRLERAADLLRTTQRTIDAIACEVGYGTGFALSNAMQRTMEQRPCALRGR